MTQKVSPKKISHFFFYKRNKKTTLNNLKLGWWQLRYLFYFHPYIGEDEPILMSIFFKGVGSTTNQ